MHQDDEYDNDYPHVKHAIQENKLSFEELDKARLTIENCEKLIELVQKRQVSNEEAWREKKKYLNRKHKQPFYAPEIKTYQALIEQFARESKSEENTYLDKKSNLLLFEVYLKEKKNKIIKQQQFDRYKQVLTSFLYSQTARINQSDQSSIKKINLELCIKKCEKLNDIVNFSQLKKMLPEVRAITKEHRENTSWQYFFKFNWLRNPTSYKALDLIFDHQDELRKKRKWF